MDRTLGSWVQDGHIPGAVALVAREDEVHAVALGAQDIDAGIPMRRDTIFRIASMTKPVTAAAAMILVEDGRLRLDEPVTRLLPELANMRVLRTLGAALDDTVPAERPITLRDALTFRLGMGAVIALPDAYPIQAAIEAAGLQPGPYCSPFDADAWLKRFASLPLLHQPGAAWTYHTGADLVAILIERASGVTLGRFLEERLFGPLNMRDTGYAVPEGKLDRLSVCYSGGADRGGFMPFDPARGGNAAQVPAFFSGGTGLTSTADDYLAFCRMMLNKGRHGNVRILSRASVELMTADHLTPAQKAASPFYPGFWDATGWGFGMAVTTRRNDYPSVGTFGWDGGLGTSARADPKEGLITILLTNRIWRSPKPEPIYSDFRTTAYQAIDD
ncbi:MAG TPA: serine hydrolase domain-containing protein [Alphaproteobacteria bacterium]|nr:serine hydrolase domain-containing protein [Alphaproteobacteria bacterium]